MSPDNTKLNSLAQSVAHIGEIVASLERGARQRHEQTSSEALEAARREQAAAGDISVAYWAGALACHLLRSGASANVLTPVLGTTTGTNTVFPATAGLDTFGGGIGIADIVPTHCA
jgi:hypothetical protein